MNNDNYNLLGHIIIADDETTFCKSTAKLLQNAGFKCDCAVNAVKALRLIEENDYDLLIADIKMQGNTNLELVKKLTESAKYISIILVTAYPSQQTAIQAVGLPVTAYMVKPIDFTELLSEAKSAVKIKHLHKIICQTQSELGIFTEQLQALKMTLASGKSESLKNSLKTFLEITSLITNNIFTSIKKATDLIGTPENQTQICQLMQCQKLSELTGGIEHAVETLRESRQAHRSKQLGTIRIKLEKLLKNIRKN